MANPATEAVNKLVNTTYQYDQKFFDGVRQNEKISKQDNFVNLVLKYENLLPFQTPFRITNPKMKEWTTIHGYPINNNVVPPKGRENFIYLSRQEDLVPAVKQQFINYMNKPAKYGLPEKPRLVDAIKVFDQTGAKGKIEYLKANGINPNIFLSELFNAQE